MTSRKSLLFDMPKRRVEMGQAVRLLISGRAVSITLVEQTQTSILMSYRARFVRLISQRGLVSVA